MDQKIKYKVFDWILCKIEQGENCFDVFECIKDIGLNPDDAADVDFVDRILQWNTLATKECMSFIFEENT